MDKKEETRKKPDYVLIDLLLWVLCTAAIIGTIYILHNSPPCN